MVSILNINNGIQMPTHEYQNCNTSQILIFIGYNTVRESLYMQVWVNIILDLHHIDTRAILPRYEGSFMVYRPNWYPKQK